MIHRSLDSSKGLIAGLSGVQGSECVEWWCDFSSHVLLMIQISSDTGSLRNIATAVQEASSRPGVLLAFIILDNPAASVLDMQAVSFAGGQPTFSKYLDSFPFPFYIILRDLAALPATLASLLRQWFELTAAGALA